MSITLRFSLVSVVILFGLLSLFPVFVYAQAGGDYGVKKVADDAGLPNTDKNISQLVGTLIRAVLGLVGTVFFVLMVYAGFMWMTSGGNSDRAGKARTLIIQAILGLIVIVLAWAITNFVISALQ